MYCLSDINRWTEAQQNDLTDLKELVERTNMKLMDRLELDNAVNQIRYYISRINFIANKKPSMFIEHSDE